MKIKLNIIFLILTLTCIHPQDKTVDISGFVKEEKTNEVVPGANVIIYKDSTFKKIYKGASTNKYGYYSIPNASVGEYYLMVSSIGFEVIKEKLVVSSSNDQLKKNFLLQQNTQQYREVTISDRRLLEFEDVSNTVKIDPVLVSKLPALGGETDIFRALQLLPGVKASSEISTGIYVRGSSASENLTLIDGVHVYNASHLGGFASTFNSDVIRDMKLIKGSFPAEYGGRLSSVLDINLREGNQKDFAGTFNVNMLSSKLALEGPLDTTMTFILSVRKMYLDRILQFSDEFDNIPRYSFMDFNGKVNYEISAKDKIFISGFYSFDKIKEPPSSRELGMDIEWINATANITWVNVTSPLVFSTTSASYTNYNFSTLFKDNLSSSNPLDFFTSSNINDFVVKRDMEFFIGEDHKFKAGAELIYHQFNTTTSDIYIPELKYKPSYGKDLNAFEASLYAQDSWDFSALLNLNAGLRLYYFQNAEFLRVEPRITLNYNFSELLVFRGSYAEANQTLHLLTRNDIYLPTDVWYPSTTNILPSTARQFSLGFEATSEDKTYLFSFETYYKDIKNLYEYRPSADFSYNNDFEKQLTKGVGHAYGFEFFFNKRIGDFTGWLGYTLAWTKRNFKDYNKNEYYYPRYDKRHDISVVLAYEVSENFNFGATWTFASGQNLPLPIGQYQFTTMASPGLDEKFKTMYEYSAPDANQLPDFHKLDLSCSYIFIMEKSSFELSLNIYNAYNRFNAFTKYISFKLNEKNEKVPVLKQFTLFPFLPTLGITYKF